MKKIVSFLLITVICLSQFIYVSATNTARQVAVKINGQTVSFTDAKPYVDVKSSRVLIPVRVISEYMGASVSYIEKDQKVVIEKGSQKVTIKLGEAKATVNGKDVSLDTNTFAKDKRIFVPLRFVSAALGGAVYWDSKTYTASIVVIPDDSVFDVPNLMDLTSAQYFEIDKARQRLLFRYGQYGDHPGYEGYVLKEKLNPNINKQIYNLTKVLMDKDNFVNVVPCDLNGTGRKNARVNVDFSMGEGYSYNDAYYFKFLFRELEPYNAKADYKQKSFSENVVISLELSGLFNFNNFSNKWIEPFYAYKLQVSLISLFGEKDGNDIYNFVLNEYLSKRTNKQYTNIYKTKTFSNIQIDFVTETNADLWFHFSYKK